MGAGRQLTAGLAPVRIDHPYPLSYRPRVGFTALNPDAFRVKKSALKAVCSQRLNELAQPVRR